MNNQCRMCKSGFSTNDANRQICDDCFCQIKRRLENDEEFRKVFLLSSPEFKKSIIQTLVDDKETKFMVLEIVISDDQILERLAKQVLKLQAKTVGLEGSGSIADFFR